MMIKHGEVNRWKPGDFEPCPECRSKNTDELMYSDNVLEIQCLDCDHTWEAQ